MKPDAKPLAPAAGGAFAVQVASSTSRADAELIAARTGAKGARVVEAEVPGKGRFYRVQVGSFATQEAARRQLAELTRAGLEGFVVTQAR